MTYVDLQPLSAGAFKRLCGVGRDTFSDMTEVFGPYLERQSQRENKIS